MRKAGWLGKIVLGMALLGAHGAGLMAALSNDGATRAYLYIKQNEDLFVGEGLATLKEFSGDEVKAKTAARERAKATLADSIRVNVKSEITEKLQLKDGKVSEDLESVSTSKTDLFLENVKYLELQDYPSSGKITVLASLSKHDYRRQLAGKKVSVYLPEKGLRFKIVGDAYTWLKSTDPGLDLGLEFIMTSYMVGFDLVSHELKNPNGTFGKSSFGITRASGLIGYNWAPWTQRIQVYFPLRLEYQHVFGNASADLFGASGGLGLRIWPNDTLALDLTGRYSVGINKVNLTMGEGASYISSLDGLELDVGILWSGF